jgi:hypothetical protein
VTDEDLHAVSAQAVIEQVQDIATLEGLEQPLQLVDTASSANPIKLVSPAMT